MQLHPSSLIQLIYSLVQIDFLGQFIVVRLQDEHHHDVFHLAQGYLSLIALRLLTALEIHAFFELYIAEE